MALQRLDGTTALIEQVIAVLDRDGGVIIENFLTSAQLAGMREDLLPLIEQQSTGRDAFFGQNTRRLSGLFAKTRYSADVVTHPLYLPAARHFVCVPQHRWSGDSYMEVTCDLQVGVSQAIQIGPGEGGQALHRDDGAFFWSRNFGREARLQVMIALTDFTAGNGGTMVVPGSHHWDDERKPLAEEAIPTEMKAGSALLFLGGVYHGGGTNRTESEWRTGVTFALDASFVRQEENHYLALTPELVASYPEEIQRLLGWSMSGRALGWIEVDGELADPNFLLRPLEESAVAGA
ncbi:phytanoyl-CoA dioxygenase family protein [Sphingopyxis terrae subsp. ummariensis]